MFKKSKGGSSFKSGKVSSGNVEKKEILEQIGYVFDSVTKKSGWNWSSSTATSNHNNKSLFLRSYWPKRFGFARELSTR